MDKDDKEKEEIKYFFGNCDIYSCAQHIEAKKLGNKYYNQMWNILDRISEISLDMTLENFDIQSKKLNGLQVKFDKINNEFMAILRSTSRCCVPTQMAKDYTINYQ